jgi:hypothetical protein
MTTDHSRNPREIVGRFLYVFVGHVNIVKFLFVCRSCAFQNFKFSFFWPIEVHSSVRMVAGKYACGVVGESRLTLFLSVIAVMHVSPWLMLMLMMHVSPGLYVG